MEISKEFKFSASHVLPNHPGLCSNNHGHNWVLYVFVEGPIDPETGMVMDYGELKKAVQPIIDDLDHAHLGAWTTNKISIEAGPGLKSVHWLPGTEGKPSCGFGFNPTSENLLVEIAKRLLRYSLVFSKLTIKETDSTSCTLTWKEFQEMMDNG